MGKRAESKAWRVRSVSGTVLSISPASFGATLPVRLVLLLFTLTDEETDYQRGNNI